MKEVSIEFQSSCEEKDLPLSDDLKVIYVFRDTSLDTNNHWNINKILYIGKSIDASGRLNNNHEKIPSAKEKLAKGHFLTFAYCVFDSKTSDESIREIENALIYKVKPCLNKENKDNYNYDSITISISGKRSTALPKCIVINKDSIK